MHMRTWCARISSCRGHELRMLLKDMLSRTTSLRRAAYISTWTILLIVELILPYALALPQEEPIRLGDVIGITYEPWTLRFTISYQGMVLIRGAHLLLNINGEEVFPALNFTGYEVVEHDERLLLKVYMKHRSCLVVHNIMIEKGRGVVILWLSIKALEDVVLRTPSPLSFPPDESAFASHNIEICSKDFWTLPSHFIYGPREELFTPIVVRDRELGLYMIIASLTSELGKAMLRAHVYEKRSYASVYTLLWNDRISIPKGQTIELDKLVILIGEDVVELFEHYASLVLEFNEPRRPRVVDEFPLRSRGWITWAYYFTNINPEVLNKEIEFIAEELRKYGYEYLIIDDGWQRRDTHYPAAYDWITPSERFPEGLREIISRAHSLGLKVVLWVAFTCFDGNSELLRTKRGMFLMKEDRVFVDDRGRAYLNVTNEEALSYIERLFATYKKWGIDGLTFDIGTFIFLYPSLELMKSNNVTFMMLFNRFMDHIDQLAAKYNMTILLKASPEVPCLARYRNCLGIRVSWDVTYRSTRRLRDIVGFVDAFFKTSFWLSKIIAPDPDALITGQNGELLNTIWALMSYRCSVIYYGDPRERADIRLLSCYPVYDLPPTPLHDAFMEMPPSVLMTYKNIKGASPIYAIGFINLKDMRSRYEVRLEDIGLSGEAFVYDVLTGKVFPAREGIDVEVEPWTIKLFHLARSENWPAVPLFISGYVSAEILLANAKVLEIRLRGDADGRTILKMVVRSDAVGVEFNGTDLELVEQLHEVDMGYVIEENVMVIKVPSNGILRIEAYEEVPEKLILEKRLHELRQEVMRLREELRIKEALPLLVVVMAFIIGALVGALVRSIGE